MKVLVSILWIDAINNVPQDGTLKTNDKSKQPVIITWSIQNSASAGFSRIMDKIADSACQAFATFELEFLQKFAQAMFTELLYKQQFDKFTKHAEINWQEVE